MTDQMPVMIAGGKASGKSLLRQLLDGHSQMFVSPFHEMLINAFSPDDLDADGCIDNDIELIKGKLACAGKYFQLEKKSHHLQQSIEAAGVSAYLPFKFDFYTFDKSWVSDLKRDRKRLTPEQILGKVYKHLSYFLEPIAPNNARSLSDGQDTKYYASMSNSYAGAVKNFLSTFPSGKVVYVNRKIEDCINGLIQRKPTDDPLSRNFSEEFLKRKYCSQDYVREVSLLEAEAFSAKAENQRILVIDFEDLFDVTTSMDAVMDFLGLSVQPINYIPSHFGISIKETTGIDLLRCPLDKHVDALTEEERGFIQKVFFETRFTHGND